MPNAGSVSIWLGHPPAYCGRLLRTRYGQVELFVSIILL